MGIGKKRGEERLWRLRPLSALGCKMGHATAPPGKGSCKKSDGNNRCGLEEKVSADGAGVRDGARGSGRFARGAARRNENAGKRNSETAVPTGRAGVSASGSHARGLQSAGKRSVAVPRLGGSAVAAHGVGERLAGNQRRRGHDQSPVGGKPAAGGTLRSGARRG